MPGLSWSEYLAAPVSQDGCVACHRTCGDAFSSQRAIIRRLIQQEHPKRVACLGAGFLNDVPVDALFLEPRETFLVDWISGAPEEGVRGGIISRGDRGYECVFCRMQDPARYCRNYCERTPMGGGVCSAFWAAGEPATYCERYVPGSEPHFVHHDVTAGVATDFAERVTVAVERSRTPRDAFRRARDLCRFAARTSRSIPIDDGSIDLVTSSMVVSQFDAEPYTYFSKLLGRRFGADALRSWEDELLPLMEELRSDLFAAQIESHVREMHRLVRKGGGKVYFAVELFRSFGESSACFLVRDIPRAMAVVGEYFAFDFRDLPPEAVLSRSQMGNGTSIVQNYVLIPHTDVAMA